MNHTMCIIASEFTHPGHGGSPLKSSRYRACGGTEKSILYIPRYVSERYNHKHHHDFGTRFLPNSFVNFVLRVFHNKIRRHKEHL